MLSASRSADSRSSWTNSVRDSWRARTTATADASTATHSSGRPTRIQRRLMRAASRRRASRHCARAGSSRPRSRRRRSRGRRASVRGRADAGNCGRSANAGSSRLAERMKRLAMRSSSEWKLMTTRRPPRPQRLDRLRQRALELAELVVDVDAQRLEGARRRVPAGLAPGHRGGDDAGEAAGRLDRRPRRARRRSRARCAWHGAPRRGARSRPRSRARRCAARNAAALMPESGSMRMSSGPSRMKLKPRRASSSCGEETPRSNRTPSALAGATCCASSEKRARTKRARVSPEKRTAAAAAASGSRSMATNFPSSPSRPRISPA